MELINNTTIKGLDNFELICFLVVRWGESMLEFPKSTEMSKQFPKKAVYSKFQMNTATKAKIDADISRITIVNEITPAKINIPAGEEVGSFFFVLEFEGQSKLHGKGLWKSRRNISKFDALNKKIRNNLASLDVAD